MGAAPLIAVRTRPIPSLSRSARYSEQLRDREAQAVAEPGLAAHPRRRGALAAAGRPWRTRGA